MKILSPIPRKRGRIEIIPLIDIMFFLLAAFMMVSIDMIKVKSLKVSLPTEVPVAQLEPKEDFVSISMNSLGQVQIEKELITDPNQLMPKLQEYYVKNKDQKFLISVDKDGRNGDVIALLGKLRTAGFQRVAFRLKGDPGASPSSPPAPASAPAPEAPASPAATPTPPATSTAAPIPPAAPTPPTAPSAPAIPTAPTPPSTP